MCALLEDSCLLPSSCFHVSIRVLAINFANIGVDHLHILPHLTSSEDLCNILASTARPFDWNCSNTSNACNPPWTRLSCVNSSITDLLLGGRNLNQSLPFPDSITNLRNLSNLDLSSNEPYFSSNPIPSILRNLTKLTSLNLASNKISGNIPTVLSTFTNVVFLYLSDNSFTGSPAILGSLTNLALLDLSRQSISTIPPEIRSLETREEK